ncbi:hypothetical protein FOZ63_017904 [Perkinsus olseni]|uniref:Uncharacterized protein n=1 Tax=Perkinsus olseni TaxID=32597 RepID=A0A7J6RYU2_PEROL|nr:hypothetical protein FOZ63_017904 [Perkinsus olseni]
MDVEVFRAERAVIGLVDKPASLEKVRHVIPPPAELRRRLEACVWTFWELEGEHPSLTAFWCTCCDAHLKSPEAVHFHTGINAHRSNLEYHDWCYQVGQDPRLYYKAGWHFPAKDSPKEECSLPKLDDMKTEDISYLTKGEAAGANYCCRCNVTLASPWEIRQHLRTNSHRERAAVGYTVDERPPLIELEADISLKEYDDDDDVKAEAFDGKAVVKTEVCDHDDDDDDDDGDDENMAEVDHGRTEVKGMSEVGHIPSRVEDIFDADKEIEEVWGVDEGISSPSAADGGEGGEGILMGGEEGASEGLPCPLSGMGCQPTADEFDMMVSSIINGEELSSSTAFQQQQLLSE